MKLSLRLILLLTVVSFVFPLKASADTSCQPIYGGGQSCIATNNIIVNKTILNPQTNQFVDNLNINNPKHQPGFITTFQVSITNTGNTNVPRIDVRDIFPQYVSFSSGAGAFDSNTNTLSFSLTNLAPNETRKYTVIGRIINAEQIPIASGSVVCVVNQAIAMVDGNNISQDNAQFCIEKTLTPATIVTTKGGFPVFPPVLTTSAPATGPEAFALLALVPAGFSGWFMIKYANKKEAVK
ncbi:MAG: hypothetical protein U1E54_01320 [Candidatus Levybacteria bacterium]|nr:hypothetical protein [Candidatus Levybacteria bacterium]